MYPLPGGNMYPLPGGNAYPLVGGNMYPLPGGNAYPLWGGNAYHIGTPRARRQRPRRVPCRRQEGTGQERAWKRGAATAAPLAGKA